MPSPFIATVASLLTNKNMWRAVLLTVTIHALASVATNHLWKQTGTDFLQLMPEEMWAVTNSTRSETGQPKDGVETKGAFSSVHKLAREVFVDLVMQLLYYPWQVWLERTFPARQPPRLVLDKAQLQEKDKGSVGSDEMEEEIMRRLLASGRVRRASLNWWNTGVKWALDAFLGTLVMTCIAAVLEGVVEWKKWAEIRSDVQVVRITLLTPT
jgi:hypothetical protein